MSIHEHLDRLEAEAIYITREVAAQFGRPVLLFSGGKDSAVLLKIAEKAFRPAKFPFPLMHVDTGHNFPEVLTYRDDTVARIVGIHSLAVDMVASPLDMTARLAITRAAVASTAGRFVPTTSTPAPSTQDFVKKSKKLPDKVGTGGAPPPKDDAAPGGGSEGTTIG